MPEILGWLVILIVGAAAIPVLIWAGILVYLVLTERK